MTLDHKVIIKLLISPGSEHTSYNKHGSCCRKRWMLLLAPSQRVAPSYCIIDGLNCKFKT